MALLSGKADFGKSYAGVKFLALVQIKSSYGHERYRLRWYTVSKTGSCIPGDVEDFGIPSLKVIQNRWSREVLFIVTKGFYTVGRPSWHTVDRQMLMIRSRDRVQSGRQSFMRQVQEDRAVSMYCIEHDRVHDPFRKIWPSL